MGTQPVSAKTQIIESIKSLGEKHSTWQVFEDFLALSSLAISNAVDRAQFEEREKQYLQIVKKYTQGELNIFISMLSNLILVLEQYITHPQDVLGEIFHELELHNKYHGQFFTPNHICDFMGKITLSAPNEVIEKKGYITMCEPTTGSGAMILGFAGAMAANHYDYQKQMVVTAIDIDIKCVYMTYLQLSLFGIPAVVIHGNSLTVEEWSHWYTPMYILGGWQFKKERPPETIKEVSACLPTITKGNGQTSFF